MKFIKDWDKKDDTGYGSHIPVLKFIFQNSGRTINFALELGMGFFSTPFLLDSVTDELTSIEMQDQEWYNKVSERYFYKTNIYWTNVYDPTIRGCLKKEGFDFVLIDGSAIMRAPAAAHYMEMDCTTIVCHDTESTWYAYHLLEDYAKKYGYFIHEFKTIAPWTRVFTKNKTLIDAIQSSGI